MPHPSPAPGLSRSPGLVAPKVDARLVLPVSDSRTRYEALAYLESHDAVSGDDHAFLAYKETSVVHGSWRVRVKSLETAGGVFEPAAIARQAQVAATQGQPYFVWGYQLMPTRDDPRQIEFRVHVFNGQASRLELHVRLRRADGSPDAPQSVFCDWPHS